MSEGRDYGRMRAAGFRHGKAAEPVRDDARRGLQMRLRHRLDLGAVVNLHDMQQQTQRPPVIAGLDGHDERGLVGPERPRLPPSSSLFSPPSTASSISTRPRACGSPRARTSPTSACGASMPPCRAAHPAGAQLQCRDRVLRLREQIHALEPFDVRQQRASKK